MQRLTIDGVPREKLRDLLNRMCQDQVSIGVYGDELRALLDAPAHCAHEWTDDGEFTLTCTECSKKENHEPYGWVQTRGDAINHFTQEWDVVESWVERGFEYKAMFDHAECDREKADGQPQGEPVAWTWVGENYERGVTLRWDVAKHLPFPVKPLYAEHPAPVAVGTVKMHGDMKCIAFGDEEWKALNVGDIIFATGARV